MRRLLVSFVAITCLGCATSPSSSSSSPVALRYGWPVGSEAMVEERIDKDGTTAVERYRVRLVGVDGQAGVQDLVIDELKMQSINGNAIDTDEERARIAPAEQLASAIPHLRIDAAGKVVDVVGLEALRAALVAAQPAEQRELFAQAVSSPEMTLMLQASAMNIWNNWVGNHDGLDLVPDVDTVTITAVEGPAGPLEQPTHHVLKLVGGRGVITTTTTTSKDVALALARPMLETLLAQAGATTGAPGSLDQLEQFSVESTSEAELDLKTLRPWRVKTTRTIRATIVGRPISRGETHLYAFTWK